METTHTTGPWHVNGVDCIMSVSGNCSVAKVFDDRDARLIAAAPELYDFVKSEADKGNQAAKEILKSLGFSD